jgi:hypothetical protein
MLPCDGILTKLLKPGCGGNRVVLLAVGWIIFMALFFPIHMALKGHDTLRKQLERGLVEFMCSVFVASWTGVVKYHGPRPSRRAKQVPFSPSSGFCHWFCLQFSIVKVFKQHCQGLMFC